MQLRVSADRYKICPFSEVLQSGTSLGIWKEEENANPYVAGAQVKVTKCCMQCAQLLKSHDVVWCDVCGSVCVCVQADRFSARPPSAYTMNFTKGKRCHNGAL